jgi:hypothetical protein
MENSAFTADSLDDGLSLEELATKVSRYRFCGSALFLSLIIYVPLGILLFRTIAEFLFLPGLFIAVFLTFVGLYFLAKASFLAPYVRGIIILQRLSPPSPVITQKYAVTRLDNTLVFVLRKTSAGLFFVSFLSSDTVPASKIDVPKVFWKWSTAVHIEGLRVHDKRGMFSVPTPEGEIRSGEGILLLVPIRGGAYMVHVPAFSRTQLLAVVEYASHLTSQAGTSNEIHIS